MKHYPDFEAFRRLARGVQLVPVYRQIAGDMLTPVTAFHQLDAGSCACLFESVIGGEKVGRYSFLAADPVLQLVAHGHHVKLIDGSESSRHTPCAVTEQPREHLRDSASRLGETRPR